MGIREQAGDGYNVQIPRMSSGYVLFVIKVIELG